MSEDRDHDIEQPTDYRVGPPDRRAPPRWQVWIPVFSLLCGAAGSWAGSQSRTAVLETNVVSLKETIKSQGDETRGTISGLTALVNGFIAKVGSLETAQAANDKALAEMRAEKDRQIEDLRREMGAMKSDLGRADDRTAESIAVLVLTTKNIQIGIARIEGELNSSRTKKE